MTQNRHPQFLSDSRYPNPTYHAWNQGHEAGVQDTREELMPLLKGLYRMADECCCGYTFSDEDIDLLKRVEGLVKE